MRSIYISPKNANISSILTPSHSFSTKSLSINLNEILEEDKKRKESFDSEENNFDVIDYTNLEFQEENSRELKNIDYQEEEFYDYDEGVEEEEFQEYEEYENRIEENDEKNLKLVENIDNKLNYAREIDYEEIILSPLKNSQNKISHIENKKVESEEENEIEEQDVNKSFSSPSSYLLSTINNINNTFIEDEDALYDFTPTVSSSSPSKNNNYNSSPFRSSISGQTSPLHHTTSSILSQPISPLSMASPRYFYKKDKVSFDPVNHLAENSRFKDDTEERDYLHSLNNSFLSTTNIIPTNEFNSSHSVKSGHSGIFMYTSIDDEDSSTDERSKEYTEEKNKIEEENDDDDEEVEDDQEEKKVNRTDEQPIMEYISDYEDDNNFQFDEYNEREIDNKRKKKVEEEEDDEINRSLINMEKLSQKLSNSYIFDDNLSSSTSSSSSSPLSTSSSTKNISNQIYPSSSSAPIANHNNFEEDEEEVFNQFDFINRVIKSNNNIFKTVSNEHYQEKSSSTNFDNDTPTIMTCDELNILGNNDQDSKRSPEKSSNSFIKSPHISSSPSPFTCSSSSLPSTPYLSSSASMTSLPNSSRPTLTIPPQINVGIWCRDAIAENLYWPDWWCKEEEDEPYIVFFNEEENIIKNNEENEESLNYSTLPINSSSFLSSSAYFSSTIPNFSSSYLSSNLLLKTPSGLTRRFEADFITSSSLSTYLNMVKPIVINVLKNKHPQSSVSNEESETNPHLNEFQVQRGVVTLVGHSLTNKSNLLGLPPLINDEIFKSSSVSPNLSSAKHYYGLLQYSIKDIFSYFEQQQLLLYTSANSSTSSTYFSPLKNLVAIRITGLLNSGSFFSDILDPSSSFSIRKTEGNEEEVQSTVLTIYSYKEAEVILNLINNSLLNNTNKWLKICGNLFIKIEIYLSLEFASYLFKSNFSLSSSSSDSLPGMVSIGEIILTELHTRNIKETEIDEGQNDDQDEDLLLDKDEHQSIIKEEHNFFVNNEDFFNDPSSYFNQFLLKLQTEENVLENKYYDEEDEKEIDQIDSFSNHYENIDNHPNTFNPYVDKLENESETKETDNNKLILKQLISYYNFPLEFLDEIIKERDDDLNSINEFIDILTSFLLSKPIGFKNKIINNNYFNSKSINFLSSFLFDKKRNNDLFQYLTSSAFSSSLSGSSSTFNRNINSNISYLEINNHQNSTLNYTNNFNENLILKNNFLHPLLSNNLNHLAVIITISPEASHYWSTLSSLMILQRINNVRQKSLTNSYSVPTLNTVASATDSSPLHPSSLLQASPSFLNQTITNTIIPSSSSSNSSSSLTDSFYLLQKDYIKMERNLIKKIQKQHSEYMNNIRDLQDHQAQLISSALATATQKVNINQDEEDEIKLYSSKNEEYDEDNKENYFISTTTTGLKNLNSSVTSSPSSPKHYSLSHNHNSPSQSPPYSSIPKSVDNSPSHLNSHSNSPSNDSYPSNSNLKTSINSNTSRTPFLSPPSHYEIKDVYTDSSLLPSTIQSNSLSRNTPLKIGGIITPINLYGQSPEECERKIISQDDDDEHIYEEYQENYNKYIQENPPYNYSNEEVEENFYNEDENYLDEDEIDQLSFIELAETTNILRDDTKRTLSFSNSPTLSNQNLIISYNQPNNNQNLNNYQVSHHSQSNLVSNSPYDLLNSPMMKLLTVSQLLDESSPIKSNFCSPSLKTNNNFHTNSSIQNSPFNIQRCQQESFHSSNQLQNDDRYPNNLSYSFSKPLPRPPSLKKSFI